MDSASEGRGGGKKKQWRRNHPPRSQWVLKEWFQFVDKMVAKRRRKVKGGWASAKSAAASSEGV